MKNLLALLVLLATVSAVGIGFTAPSGSYVHGTIPVAATFVSDQTMTFQLVESNIVLETKTASSSNSDYSTSFEVLEKGSYEIRASATLNGTDYANSTAFEVNTSKIYITIISPENKTYDGAVPFEVLVEQDGSFLHSVKPLVAIFGLTNIGYAQQSLLPEAQNSYRNEWTMPAGRYVMSVLVNGEESEDVYFTVAGEAAQGNETEYIPGLKPMEIKRTAPARAEYALGESADIIVYPLDIDNQRVSGAVVKAVFKTPSGSEQSIPLQEKLVSGKPTYSNTYTFTEEGFYEVKITAEKAGYESAELYMPAIKAGEEKPTLPADVFCQQGICVRVESPTETETYPEGSSVELRLQVIEESTRPIADANVTANLAGADIQLTYDWNGYYSILTGNMSAGDHPLVFTVQKEGITIQKNTTLHVSADTLVITPIVPVPGGNVTDDYITMQVKVTDQRGDVVTNANVRAIVTLPLTGTRTIPLARNAATGYYESEFSFSDPGQHTIKVIASRIGYVSSEAVYTFDVVIAKEGVQLTEQDVVIAALIIGVLLVIATVWKAFL